MHVIENPAWGYLMKDYLELFEETIGNTPIVEVCNLDSIRLL